VLVLVLKRFRVDAATSLRYKLTNTVSFPTDGADFSPFVVPPTTDEPDGAQRSNALYDLSAVVNHHGGLRGGHYTCYARARGAGGAGGADDGPSATWLHLNDSSVRMLADADHALPLHTFHTSPFDLSFTHAFAPPPSSPSPPPLPPLRS
jgi:ubiquitin C-terminal hydrolase